MLCTSREQWVWPLSVEEHSRVTLWLSGLGTGAKPSAPISTVPALSPAQLLPFSLLSEPHFFFKEQERNTPNSKGSIFCLQCDLEFCNQDSRNRRRWVF